MGTSFVAVRFELAPYLRVELDMAFARAQAAVGQGEAAVHRLQSWLKQTQAFALSKSPLS